MNGSFWVRESDPADVEEMSRVFFHSFNSFNDSVGLPPEWPSLEFCQHAVQGFLDHPGYMAFTALDRLSGRILGSNFLEYHDSVAAPGPISVAEEFQGVGVGRMLWQASLDAAQEIGKESVQAVQLASNVKSFGLYARMGFIPREQLIALTGFPSQYPELEYERFLVRPMEMGDIHACGTIFERINGYSRAHDIALAASGKSPWADPYVVENADKSIVGYTTGLSLLGHMCCNSEDAMQALFLHASKLMQERQKNPPLIHLPGRLYPESLLQFLTVGVKVLRLETLISRGVYNYAQNGCYCPGMAY
ncbi:GNAT family N-acetyltransferase [Streptomyces sp. 3211]|uniref:GNAT family N-acetyltransferase n=1 Tax=Streptomyces sp. 3211 TaxID=1964449 RepID=UPI0009A4F06D|nr:GNAT family N-acetyltransferase [Streptomyces sp. 3211]